MRKIDGWMLKAFCYGFPVIAAMILFLLSRDAGTFAAQCPGMNDAFGTLLIGWLAVSFYVGGRMAFSGPFREETLTKLVMLRENDEREDVLTGKATRAVFLSTLGLLIFAFGISILTLRLEKLPPASVVNGKAHVISIGFVGLSSLGTGIAAREVATESTVLLNHCWQSVSPSLMILFLIVWQIVCYNISIRRALAITETVNMQLCAVFMLFLAVSSPL